MKFPKLYSFYFNGEMHEAGGRPRMLAPFASQPRSRIVASGVGRYSFMKSRFNGFYFANLAMSKFGLCPHHADWPGDVMWTYRFVECAMVGTLPVVFRETPLDEQFTRGFYFLWDDEVCAWRPDAVQVLKWSKANRSLAESRFRLPTNLSV